MIGNILSRNITITKHGHANIWLTWRGNIFPCKYNNLIKSYFSILILTALVGSHVMRLLQGMIWSGPFLYSPSLLSDIMIWWLLCRLLRHCIYLLLVCSVRPTQRNSRQVGSDQLVYRPGLWLVLLPVRVFSDAAPQQIGPDTKHSRSLLSPSHYSLQNQSQLPLFYKLEPLQFRF